MNWPWVFEIKTHSAGPYGSMPITRIGWDSEVLVWIRHSSTFSMIWWTSFQLKGFRVLTALQVHKIVEPCGHGIMDLYIGQVPVNSNWLGLDRCLSRVTPQSPTWPNPMVFGPKPKHTFIFFLLGKAVGGSWGFSLFWF